MDPRVLQAKQVPSALGGLAALQAQPVPKALPEWPVPLVPKDLLAQPARLGHKVLRVKLAQ